MAATLQIEQSPHLHSGRTTHKFMFDFKTAIYTLSALVVVMQFLYVLLKLEGTIVEALLVALRALGLILTGGISAIITEGLWWKFAGNNRYQGLAGWFRMNTVNVPAITGVLVALTLPVSTPFYVVLIGSVVAIIFGKCVYGGLGKNIFNPALVGRGFVGLSFGTQISTSYAKFVKSGIDAVSSASPLSVSAILGDGVLKYYEFTDLLKQWSLTDLLLGFHPGAMGEVLSLFIIITFFYLVYKKTISWYVPTIYVGVIFAMTWIVGIMLGLSGDGGLRTLAIYYPIYYVLTGGVLFGAVYMLTEPVTSPVTPIGRVYFAIYAAVITFVIRMIGSYPEGVMFSILIMNMFVPLIDNITGNQSRGITWKRVLFFVLTLGVVFGLTIFVGYQLGGSL